MFGDYLDALAKECADSRFCSVEAIQGNKELYGYAANST